MMSIGVGSRKYFEKEFDAAQERYFGGGDREATGKLAVAFGLKGTVTREAYARLCDGRHPITNHKLIRDVRGETYVKDGETRRRVGHRAGWDVTFSAPKSVSEAALVGEDARLVAAHRKAVRAALTELEKFAQARTGALSRPRTTGNLCVIQFEHDAARPVDGFAAPQLHTHNFVMNMTRDGSGKYRSLNTRAMYEAQHYLTTVYRAALAEAVLELGYRIEPTRNGAFELAGYDGEYLTAISPRSVQRDEALRARGLEYSPAAAQAAVLDTRESKLDVSEEEIRRRWAARATAFGANRPPQPEEETVRPRAWRGLVEAAVRHGLETALDRTGEAEETRVLAEALKFRIGEVGLAAAKRNLAGRIGLGEVIEASSARPVGTVTTPEFARLRRETEAMAQRETPEVSGRIPAGGLGPEERRLAVGAARCRAQVVEIDGARGAAAPVAKSVAEGLRGAGYQVTVVAGGETFGDRNVAGLAEAERSGPTVFVVADGAMTSLRAVHGFLSRLEPEDRVLVVGDARRRLAAGENQLMGALREAGMPVFSVTGEIRARNDQVLEAVRGLTEGKSAEALGVLAEAGRVVAESNPDRRAALAAGLCRGDAVVVTADASARERVTALVRAERREAEVLSDAEETFRVLVPRREMTGAARAKVDCYQVGDVVEYRETSARFAKGERAVVAEVTGRALTVETEAGERVTYDPRFLRGVTVYEEREKAFAVGDRVRFTGDDARYGITAAMTGEIREMTPERVTVAVTEKRGEREVAMAREDFRAVDHGYAVAAGEDLGIRPGRVIVETAGRHAKATFGALREATADVRIVTDDIAGLSAATAKLFPARGRKVAPDAGTLVVTENPDLVKAAVEVRASRVAAAYEAIHRSVTGEGYAGKALSEMTLETCANTPPRAEYVRETERLAKAAGIETAAPADALAAVAERVRVVTPSTLQTKAALTREVLAADGVAPEKADRMILSHMLDRARALPEARQIELATLIVERALELGGQPPMNQRERELVTTALTTNDQRPDSKSVRVSGHLLVGWSPQPGEFRDPPRTEREAVLAAGLATGILWGVARQPDRDLVREVAQGVNDHLGKRMEPVVTAMLKGLSERDGLCAASRDLGTFPRMVLMVDDHGLTQANWNALKQEFGANQGIVVAYQSAMTPRDQETLAEATRRNPKLQTGTVESLGDWVRVNLDSGSGQTRTVTINHSQKPERQDRGFRPRF
jgi:conjugative relaxase-like TrwC/TraI family protein